MMAAAATRLLASGGVSTIDRVQGLAYTRNAAMYGGRGTSESCSVLRVGHGAPPDNSKQHSTGGSSGGIQPALLPTEEEEFSQAFPAGAEWGGGTTAPVRVEPACAPPAPPRQDPCPCWRLTHSHLLAPQDLREFLQAAILKSSAPEQALRQLDALSARHVDALRALTKRIQVRGQAGREARGG